MYGYQNPTLSALGYGNYGGYGCSVGSWYGDCGCDSSFSDGAMTAMSIFAVANMGVSIWAANRQNKENASAPIDDKQAEIDDALKEMPSGYNTESTYNNTDYSKLQEAKNVSSKETEVANYKKEVELYDKDIKDYEKQLTELEGSKSNEQDSAKKAKIEESIANIKSKKTEAETKKAGAEAKQKTAEKELETAKSELETKINDIKAKQEEISKLIAEKAKLVKEAQAKTDAHTLNTADGNFITRTLQGKSESGQLMQATKAFRKGFEKWQSNGAQTSGEEYEGMKALAKKFYSAYKNVNAEKLSQTDRQSYDIVNRYFPESNLG